MAHKNRTLSDAGRWGIYLIVGVLFMTGIVFFSDWRALRTTEGRFCQTLDFVKSQSTSFEKYNDIVAAKALRRTAVSVHQLAQDPALDLSDPQCLNKQTEKLWLTGISVRSCANPQQTASAMLGLESSSKMIPFWTFLLTRKRPTSSGSCWKMGLLWMLRHTGQKAKM